MTISCHLSLTVYWTAFINIVIIVVPLSPVECRPLWGEPEHMHMQHNDHLHAHFYHRTMTHQAVTEHRPQCISHAKSTHTVEELESGYSHSVLQQEVSSLTAHLLKLVPIYGKYIITIFLSFEEYGFSTF